MQSRNLFLLRNNDASFCLLPYFLKYYKKYEEDIELVKPFFSGKIEKQIYDGEFLLEYKNKFIKIFFYHPPDIQISDCNTNEENTEIVNNFLKEKNLIGFDKIFIFEEWLAFQKIKNFSNVEIITFKVDENWHESDSVINDLLLERKIISSASIGFSNNNFYFDPLINLFFFYYKFEFDYVSYKDIENNKKNLIGMYYIPNYKGNRDLLFKYISNKLYDRIKILPEVYDTRSNKPQMITKYLEMHRGKWYFGPSCASYTDYINSVCGFVFDTLSYLSVTGPNDGRFRFYLNEKSLKAIIFSNLNIPFILDTNPYNFKILNDFGFWFLNSEFFNFDLSTDDQKNVGSMLESIKKSLDYLIECYIENNYNLNLTHKLFVNKFGIKMKNNYNLFIKYLSDPPKSDKMLEFIFKN